MNEATVLNSASRRTVRKRVAVAYPFFAHYREPVLRELMTAGRHDYVLIGDIQDPSGGIPVLRFKDDPRFIRTPLITLGGSLVWQRGLWRIAWRRDIDCFIFLGNAFLLATWLAAALARLRGRRVLFWTHGWTRRERGLKAFVRMIFYRLAHGLLLYGHAARQIGVELGFAPSTLHVIYNSLDVAAQRRLRSALTAEDIARTRQTLFARPELPVVIGVGRLTHIKRFDLLINAAALLAADGRRTNLLLVGSGPAESELRELAARLKVNVTFYGACYEESMLARLYAIASVTVSPGNVGLTCMHSLGYGVPVITHDDRDDQMPEWEAIVPGLTGDLYKKDSVADLAATMSRWICGHGVSERTALECSRIIAQRYDPLIQMQLIERAISDGSDALDASYDMPGVELEESEWRR